MSQLGPQGGRCGLKATAETHVDEVENLAKWEAFYLFLSFMCKLQESSSLPCEVPTS